MTTLILYAFCRHYFYLKIHCFSQVWWHTPLASALRRQSQERLGVQGQPDLHIEI